MANIVHSKNILIEFTRTTNIPGWLKELCYRTIDEGYLSGWYLLGAWLKKSSWKGFHLKPWQNMAVFLGVGQLCVLIALAAAFMGVDKGTYSYISPLQVI